jgi:hypothetical protein
LSFCTFIGESFSIIRAIASHVLSHN